jgi:fluoroacetyl-CoA thioesterase
VNREAEGVMGGIEVGLRGTSRLRVASEHTAESLGSGDVPVFGTPALVALMETAAVNALAGHLAPDETSVGTWLELAHLAATPVGAEVRADAELVAVEGRILTFAVTAYDPREKIGEGRHRRAVVTRDRFLRKVGEKR